MRFNHARVAPSFEMPAIRRPEQFTQAIERGLDLVSVALNNPNPALLEEITTLTDAVKSAPFQMADGRVVPKGFTPRIVT